MGDVREGQSRRGGLTPETLRNHRVDATRAGDNPADKASPGREFDTPTGTGRWKPLCRMLADCIGKNLWALDCNCHAKPDSSSIQRIQPASLPTAFFRWCFSPWRGKKIHGINPGSAPL